MVEKPPKGVTVVSVDEQGLVCMLQGPVDSVDLTRCRADYAVEITVPTAWLSVRWQHWTSATDATRPHAVAPSYSFLWEEALMAMLLCKGRGAMLTTGHTKVTAGGVCSSVCWRNFTALKQWRR
jgi:hypothetical protein